VPESSPQPSAQPSAKPAERKIPAWSCDGRRLRACSLAACERLVGLSKATAKRNSRGEIRALHFRDLDGGSALRAVATMGQRYSSEVQIGEVRLWQHNELETGPQDFARVVIETLKGQQNT
jgi:hypothetical protein